MATTIIIFIVSIVALVKGSDFFVEGAEKLGAVFGIPSFIIGVTIVAFGTSLPELASSIASVYAGESGIVVGNVVGSNITNILLVVGCVAVYSGHVDLKKNIMNIDIPLLIGSAFLLLFTLYDGHLSIVECLLFLVCLVLFLLHSLTTDMVEEETECKFEWKIILLLLFGGILVFIGAKYCIESLIEIAKVIGVGSEIIALSLVALGTSLPEVVVSLAAARRGQTGMAIGNVLGSNIFNTYAVMAIPGLITSLEIPSDVIDFHLPLMVGVTILFAFMCMSRKISRYEGGMLLVFYVFFSALLIQQSF